MTGSIPTKLGFKDERYDYLYLVPTIEFWIQEKYVIAADLGSSPRALFEVEATHNHCPNLTQLKLALHQTSWYKMYKITVKIKNHTK